MNGTYMIAFGHINISLAAEGYIMQNVCPDSGRNRSHLLSPFLVTKFAILSVVDKMLPSPQKREEEMGRCSVVLSQDDKAAALYRVTHNEYCHAFLYSPTRKTVSSCAVHISCGQHICLSSQTSHGFPPGALVSSHVGGFINSSLPWPQYVFICISGNNLIF